MSKTFVLNTQRGFSMWNCRCRAQAVTCHCATIDITHCLALSPALMQNWVLQSREHHSMPCSCATVRSL